MFSGLTLQCSPTPREDGEFGARVQAIDVFGRIGLGEAKLLRLAQSRGEGNAGAPRSG